ncbi:hypothetical protein AN640_00625 [Candidatus Epulonipiscium fishelsonii]|uniref:Uncharacterized protein n=1 Tax=Candidatus Epulonipiscium fishelsonii TaxID=77094 RepID=A0ACC8X804_9FIRM|nr:hypothetical protein AN640_00625 [Epulopiscium sp. SCG-D08WGA-EpuloA1]
MKNSGIEWIGKIPADWQVNNLGKYFTERRENVSDIDYLPLSVTKLGIVPQLKTVAKSNNHESRKLVLEGDFVINSRSDRKQSCGLSNYIGSVSLINIVLINKYFNEKYLQYLFNNYGFAEEFYKFGTGIAADLCTTNYVKMKKISIPIPSAEEQERIGIYLDKKCSALNNAMEKIKDTIEEYRKLKQSIITEVVTKGLNPDTETKDSGVEWIGKIPKHWQANKLKNLVVFNPTIKYKLDKMDKVGYTPMECVKNGYMISREIESSQVNLGLTPFENEDIILAKVTPCFENGNIALATQLKNNISFGSSELIVIRCINIFNKFMLYFLQNELFKNTCISSMTGTGGLKRVPTNVVKNYSMYTPPQEEQIQIAEYLDKKCADIDAIVSQKQELLKELEDYKKSLIYECVTGKREIYER